MTTLFEYYVNLGFTWFLVVLAIWGYVATLRNTGQKLVYWLFLGLAWALLGVSHALIFSGVPHGLWYLSAIRIAGYAIMVISVISLMVHIVNKE